MFKFITVTSLILKYSNNQIYVRPRSQSEYPAAKDADSGRCAQLTEYLYRSSRQLDPPCCVQFSISGVCV